MIEQIRKNPKEEKLNIMSGDSSKAQQIDLSIFKAKVLEEEQSN